MKKAKILGVQNSKGGVGKSTISVNVSCYLSRFGRVLIIDADHGQYNSYKWYLRREDKDNITAITVETEKPLDHCTPVDLNNSLVKTIQENITKYDFIIIDGSPKLGLETSTIIGLSKLVIIPMTPSQFSLEGSFNTEKRTLELKESDSNIKAKYVLNQYDYRKKISRQAKKALRKSSLPLFKTLLVDRVAYAESVNPGMSVFEWSDSKAEKEMESFCIEVKNLLRGE